MPLKKKVLKKAALGMGILGAAFFILAEFLTADSVHTMNISKKGSKEIIAIDPGHGGFDPGKVGVSGSLEKDINLSIALKLRKVLEDSGYTVYMTRETDMSLCDGSQTGKKRADLAKRVEIIEKSEPALTISIHQNSYSAGTSGAQVFYYSHSERGKKLAGLLQEQIKELVQPENHRVEKENSSYYMLKQVSTPLVIVECGFLSNPSEEQLLLQENYQEKLACAIGEGVEKFLYN